MNKPSLDNLMRSIIGAVMECDLYGEVSFLNEKDFKDTVKVPYRQIWKAICVSGGDQKSIFKNHGWVYNYVHLIFPYVNYRDLIEVQKRALLLVECKVFEFVSLELNNCLVNSSNQSELLFLTKLNSDWNDVYLSNKDVLKHFDTIQDYCESYLDKQNMGRVTSMVTKVEKRLLSISNYINERSK